MALDLIAKTSIIKYKVITEEALTKLTSLFAVLKSEMETVFASYSVESLYEITTKEQTYSGPSPEEFEKEYQKNYKANRIRIVIQVSDPEQQPAVIVSTITLVLDKTLESSLSVVGLNDTWVNGVFGRFNEVLRGVPNRNGVLHNVLLEMSIQLLTVFVITTFSIFAANRLASSTSIKYSEVYIFLVILLLLSNLWTYASRSLLAIRNIYYPVVDITRVLKRRIFLATISFIAIVIVTWAIGYFLNFLFL